MTTPMFSTYRQGENRVTATFLAVLQRLSLPNIDRILQRLLWEDGEPYNLVSFENQVHAKESVPDAKIQTGNTIWIETKTGRNAVGRDQINRHLKSVSEGEVLLVLTPDESKPTVLHVDKTHEGKIAWSNFSALTEVIEEILGDEYEPPTEREAFLLRELVLMLREDGLLDSGDPKVAVVAASSAWPMFQTVHVYCCLVSLPFRSTDQFDRMAFYANGEIKHLVPKVIDVVESINLTRKEEIAALDSSAKELAEKLFREMGSTPEWHQWFGGDRKVMFLSAPNDSETIDLKKSIVNDKKSDSGKTVPFTYGKPRYVSLASLQKACTTTELEQLEKG
ncbi:MAG: hypothetical protein OXL37_10680 [Chloroflexota bacterium]|nr:hypothetical protein [Chloroflexota bacterium]MDE2960615.1 hypothetical protein [Chloroflexota bacterium]